MNTTKKYAVRFPELNFTRAAEQVSIFSESRIVKTEKTFLDTLDAAGSVAKLIVQKNKTSELGKRLAAQRQALDAEIESKIEQQRIYVEQETERMRIRLKKAKQDMEMEFERMRIEQARREQEFQFSFEEAIRTSQIFHNIIQSEKSILDEIHEKMNELADNYTNRREYIRYCELERSSLGLIAEYMKKMT